MTIHDDLYRVELTERERVDGARYLCVRCRQAYNVFCLNPACKRTSWRFGNTDKARQDETEFVRAVKNERRSKRDRENAEARERAQKLFIDTAAAIKEWKASHPGRKWATTELAVAAEAYSASWSTHDDPYFDPFMPKRVGIYWQPIRVNLANGTWQNSSATKIDVPRVA